MIATSRLQNIVKSLSQAKILVLGDVMLDVYIWGRVNRISPEAPVPVVEVIKESSRLGGAANVINNLIALDVNKVFLVGVIGSDETGRQLKDNLNALGLNTDGLIEEDNRPTTVKTRIIAHNQQVVRVDKEKRYPISQNTVKKILNFIEARLSEIDAILISDYAKGVICPPLMEGLRKLVKGKEILITVDPKVKNIPLYYQVTLITPNHFEAVAAAGFNGTYDITEDIINKAAHKLLNQLQPQALLITQGPDGMTLFEKDSQFHIPAMAKKVFDVTGAGDTVIATLTAAWASGATLKEAAYLANLAAGIVVGEVGTATVTQNQLLEALK